MLNSYFLLLTSSVKYVTVGFSVGMKKENKQSITPLLLRGVQKPINVCFSEYLPGIPGIIFVF